MLVGRCSNHPFLRLPSSVLDHLVLLTKCWGVVAPPFKDVTHTLNSGMLVIWSPEGSAQTRSCSEVYCKLIFPARLQSVRRSSSYFWSPRFHFSLHPSLAVHHFDITRGRPGCSTAPLGREWREGRFCSPSLGLKTQHTLKFTQK